MTTQKAPNDKISGRSGKTRSGFGLGDPKVPMGRNMDAPIAGQPKKNRGKM